MQKNAVHEIWTWLPRKVLQGIRAYDCDRVQGVPFDACSQDISRDHNQRKKG